MPGTLHIYRGLPGSGKTTAAKAMQEQYGGVLAGRDHFRALYGTENNPGERVIEEQITTLQTNLILHALSVGDHVFVDDMNLRRRYVKRLIQLAQRAGAEWHVYDLTDVPLSKCIGRDVTRIRSVGEDKIRDLHKRFIAGQKYPLSLPELPAEEPVEVDRYEGNPKLPWAVVVDIDGTVADHEGRRSPYDMTRVSGDAPKQEVIMIVRALRNAGLRIVFVSARNEVARRATERWIQKNISGGRFELFMREDGDGRPDPVVKKEIFDREIRDRYFVRAVFDDRDRVVAMWRSLGLTCLQVAPGDF
ncbi:AAA family ATPase [Amycolatopsis sp.]|uniref:phosphatase domain-containing protein n=1 Tax=Amycolatopsis sp. TaxID=37632 RepID=UPI002C1009CF|nr:AAA family ATPase [Amycolatopsis sp.]HVV11630.1 AAA family ATPase [Amycolatopsis sp.]